MPFTEEELRAVLEDNSAEVPPVGDLTANAERQGRKIRKRRYAAGAVAATCALAAGVGVLTLPGLVDNSGRVKPVAASVSPSPKPVHVDASVLAGAGDGRQLTAERLKQLALSASGQNLLRRMDPMQGAWPTLSGMTAFADVVVTGTVEGFTVGQMRSPGARPPTTAKALTSVVMRVRVDKTINGSAPGTQIYVRAGSGSDAALQKFQTAIPAGARLVAFLDQLPSPLGDGGDGTGHPAGTPLMDQQQGLIFEDQGTTGTTLVGGPYQSKHLDKPWTQATTMDQLVPLLQTDLQTLTDDCAKLDARLRAKPPATMAKPGDLSLMRLRCYRLRPSGATPTPSP